MDSVLMRVSKDFRDWCKKMKEVKKQQTKNKNEYLSDKRITELIPKHAEITPILESEILNYVWGRR
jgi:hypothetical protein